MLPLRNEAGFHADCRLQPDLLVSSIQHKIMCRTPHLQAPSWGPLRRASLSMKMCRLRANFCQPPESAEPSPLAAPSSQPLSQPPTLRPQLPTAPPSAQPQPPQQPPSQRPSCGNSMHCQVGVTSATQAIYACWRQAKPQSNPHMGLRTLQAASW